MLIAILTDTRIDMDIENNPGPCPSANQLISQYLEQHQCLSLQKEHINNEIAAAYSSQLDEAEATFDARLGPWRVKRQHLHTALSEAKLRLQQTQKEIAKIEQSLELVTKYEKDVKLDCQVKQKRIINEYERSKNATLSDRQQSDLQSSTTLIRNLVYYFKPRFLSVLLTNGIKTRPRR